MYDVRRQSRLPTLYIGRFAPSPTGPLHFGSLVAALGSFLQARSQGGQWRLRIEDLDPPRIVPGATDRIRRTLARHGLDHDGPVLYQSERHQAYQAALAQLQQQGLVYACTCSRKTLRETAIIGPYGPIYPGTCRDAGHPCAAHIALRLRTDCQQWGFVDGVQGWFGQCLATEVGDFVLRRNDGIFSYQLAVVVDDHAQGVTEVIRGADLLDSTPRQRYLYHCLGLPPPDYAHLPVALDRDGDKLSKQTGARALDDGQAPAQLCAALHHLGQPLFRGAERADVATILDWAIAHWQLGQIPRRRGLNAPTMALT